MTAIEYLIAKGRMTNECRIDCDECPLCYDNSGELCGCRILEQNYPEKAVEIVEKWAKEHPIKTRQSEFLKMFPDSELDSNGIIDICPIVMYHKYTCSGLITCDECRAEFWKEEIE